MKLVTSNLDPVADSIEPLAELIMNHSHLSPQQAEAVVRTMLDGLWSADAFTSERE